jgi:hypothetical protein
MATRLGWLGEGSKDWELGRLTQGLEVVLPWWIDVCVVFASGGAAIWSCGGGVDARLCIDDEVVPLQRRARSRDGPLAQASGAAGRILSRRPCLRAAGRRDRCSRS